MSEVAGGLVKKRRSKKAFRDPKLDNSYLDSGTGRVIQVSGREQIAVEYDAKAMKDIPPGYCVINIQVGADTMSMEPVEVTYFDWSIKIPRGTDRVVPLQHVEILNNCIETQYRQPVYGEELEAIPAKRYPFVVKKWPDATAIDIDPSLLQQAKDNYEQIDVDAL